MGSHNADFRSPYIEITQEMINSQMHSHSLKNTSGSLEVKNLNSCGKCV